MTVEAFALILTLHKQPVVIPALPTMTYCRELGDRLAIIASAEDENDKIVWRMCVPYQMVTVAEPAPSTTGGGAK